MKTIDWVTHQTLIKLTFQIFEIFASRASHAVLREPSKRFMNYSVGFKRKPLPRIQHVGVPHLIGLKFNNS